MKHFLQNASQLLHVNLPIKWSIIREVKLMLCNKIKLAWMACADENTIQ